MKRDHMVKLSHSLTGRGQHLALRQLLQILYEDLSLSTPLEEATTGFSPSAYADAASCADAYLIHEFLSKYPFRVPGLDRAKVALDAFAESEQQCSLTNLFVGVDTGDTRNGVTWPAVLHTAREKISHLLGPFSWDLVDDHCDFGPGATTSLRRDRSDAFYKFGHKPDVTQDCALLAWWGVYTRHHWFEALTGQRPSGDWVADYWRFQPSEIFNLVPGNRVTTVPKNAKTDRVIAIEPDLNMFFQKGIGSLIRRRLLRANIDLNDQSRNQRLAKEGSITGALATIDFKAASDTISIGIVEQLLPEDWLVALKQTRSPCGVLPDGSTIQYAKFSSMGNGYTFELESLIFWALARSVLDLNGEWGVVSVYGDDLIVPTGHMDSLIHAFARAGFTLNEKKSFWEGPFRESCGKHFFRGCDVTPVYVRREIRTLWDLFTLANKLKRWSRLSWGLDSRVKRAYDFVVGAIPPPLRIKICDGVGDVGLISDFDECRPRWDRNLSKVKMRTILPRLTTHEVSGLPALVKWYHRRRNRPLETEVSILSKPIVTSYRYGRVEVSQRSDWGPWL